MTDIRWATFDCYGTLIDWRHGIATGIDLIFPGSGIELLEIFNRHEPAVQFEYPALRYRSVLAEAFRRTADEAGLTLGADDADVLGATIGHWPAFTDTAGELARLRDAGWRVALLTNCDRDIIGEAQRRLITPVDAIVTAEDVGAYKPDHRHFDRFATTFGATTENWVHVAQSYFHDMVPAQALGVPRIWINRRGESDDPSIADAILPDLTRLTETVIEVNATYRGVMCSAVAGGVTADWRRAHRPRRERSDERATMTQYRVLNPAEEVIDTKDFNNAQDAYEWFANQEVPSGELGYRMEVNSDGNWKMFDQSDGTRSRD